MLKYLIILLLFPQPLGLDWEKKHTTLPNIDGYKYFYGDIYWDPVVYYGTEDLLGLETEIHIHFGSKKITRAFLILGPSGLNNRNCLIKYKEVVKVLSQKYGNYRHTTERVDPLIEELIYSSRCYTTRLGMYQVRTHWSHKDRIIEASLLGDSDGLYIEISYIDLNRSKQNEIKEKNKIFKKLSKEL